MSYDHMAQHYDRIFPTREETVFFLERALPRGDILDSACGTGNYALALAENGVRVTGIDISGAMIDLAEKKAAKQGLKVDFRREDMRALQDEAIYDGVFCIGNSLVHLSGHDEVLDYLKRVWKALKDNGRAVFQIVNYDRVYDQRITTLPTVQQDDLVFERHYDLHEDKVLFRQVLKTEEGTSEETVKLHPLKRDDMETLLRSAGFRNLSFHDGFTDKAFSVGSSFALVVQGEKKEGSA